MEARVALQLLSEELLLPLPHEGALLPWTIEEPASSPLPSWEWEHKFLAGQLWILQLNCFERSILPAASGVAGLGGFLPLIYLSPGAGLSISSGQTGWHIILIIALSLRKETPVKGFWESEDV